MEVNQAAIHGKRIGQVAANVFHPHMAPQELQSNGFGLSKSQHRRTRIHGQRIVGGDVPGGSCGVDNLRGCKSHDVTLDR